MMQKIVMLLLLLSYLAVYGADGNNYKVNRTILGSADKPGKINTVRFEVIDSVGSSNYTVDVAVDYDLPYPAGYVYGNGALAVVWSYDASVELYDNDGKFVTKHFIAGKNNIEYERSVMAAADDDNLVLVFSDTGSRAALVELVNSSGEVISKWNSGYKNITGVAYNSIQNLIVLSGYNFADNRFKFTTSIYVSSGEKLMSIDKSFRKGEFVSESSLIAYDNRNAFVLNTDSYKVMEEFQSEDSQIIMDAYYDGESLFTAVTPAPELNKGNWVYSGLSVVKIKDGKFQNRQALSTDKFQKAAFITTSNGLKILVDGSEISTD